jgi:CheY-like chemotaxis protein
VLELQGYDVRQAASGEEALQLLDGWRPDVLLSDVGLPGMDGYELMRRIRQIPEQRPLLALAVTGYGAEEDRAQALAAGFDGHVIKPLDPSLLDRRIRETLPERA